SSAAIIQCPSYEENIGALLQKYAKELSLPSLKGKTVIVKPNMVEYRANNLVNTNTNMVAAVVQLADYLGASKVIVAEGPGHFRDMEYLLEATGIGSVCSRLGVPFLDLNLDSLEKVPNPDGLCKTDHFFLPKTVVESGVLMSVPKLKTHHWVGITCSMKNLFGVVPGRKYGWPKNFLHYQGIPNAILDLVRVVKPTLAIVDGIIGMEGDGPINGTAHHSKFIVMGTDVAAVDATCARLIGMDPHDLPYLRIAGEIIGNIAPSEISLVGAPFDSVKTVYEWPPTYKDKRLLTPAI